MAITVKHTKVSTIPDGDDSSLIRPSDWNDDHALTGLGTMAEQNANAVAITGGTISGVAVTGYVPTTETISAGTGLTGGGDLSAPRTISLANTAVTPGTYGSDSRSITQVVDQQGRLTNIYDQPIAIAYTAVSGLGTAATKDAGVANGVATLDGGGTVPISQLPAAVLGALNYQGTWNASTNTPTLTSSVGTKGYYYVVSVAGTTNLNGITDWQVGDWAVYNGTAWQKIDNTDAVTSVNGYTGTVVLTNTDISGFGTMSTQNANAVAITSGTINGTTIGATTPAVITGTTINADTKVVSPDYYAQSILGGNLRTSGGTSLLNWDGGGSGNVSVNGGLTANPSNKNVSISPTGTGTATINPATTGTMDNMVIGGTTPKAITGTTITGTTFVGSGASLTGVVTSVSATSPVVSSGGATPAISLATGYGDTQNPYASKTANYVLAAPNGVAGAPTFRAIVAADIPTLNQNTTGTASNVTGTVAIANGGSGATTAQTAMNAFAGAVTSGSYLRGNGTNVVMSTIQAADVPTLNQNTTGTASNVTGTVAVANGGTGATTAATARTNLGATTVGGNFYTLANPTAITFPRINADNTVSALDAATFRTAIGAGTGSGTVTSVTGTAPVVSSGGTTPAISMAAATTSVSGYLTSTDWNTFNGKAPAVTYTSTYVPYGQGTTTPNQSSTFTYNGTSLTAPSHIANTAISGSTNVGPYSYGTLNFSDTNIFASYQTSVNSYAQVVVQNTNAGASASAEFVAYNNSGTASTNYACVGMNSSGYTGTGSINAAGYGYFLTGSTDLVVGTIGANAIHFTTNSSAVDSIQISSAGNVTTPNGIWENSNTISQNYTIGTNQNAMSAGPMTIATGVTVTVPTGSTWVIV